MPRISPRCSFAKGKLRTYNPFHHRLCVHTKSLPLSCQTSIDVDIDFFYRAAGTAAACSPCPSSQVQVSILLDA